MIKINRTQLPTQPGGPGWYVREENDAAVVCESFGPDVAEMTEGHPRGMLILRHFILACLEPIQLRPKAKRGYGYPSWIDLAILDWWNANVPPHDSEVTAS